MISLRRIQPLFLLCVFNLTAAMTTDTHATNAQASGAQAADTHEANTQSSITQAADTQTPGAQTLEKQAPGDNNLNDNSKNIYQLIAKENFKTLNEIDFMQQCIEDYNLYKDQGLDAYLKAEFKRLLNPNPDKRRKAMFNLLVQFEEKSPLPHTDVLDFKTWSDLELLCGPKSDMRLYLASKLDRTVTEAGKVSLYRKLINPESDIHQLQNQQEITSLLLTNEACFNEIDEKLKALVTSENLMLSFWYSDFFGDWERETGKVKLPFSSLRIPFTSKSPNIKNFENWMNKNFPISQIKQLEDWVNKRPALIRGMKLKGQAFQCLYCALTLYWFIAVPTYTLNGKDIRTYFPDKISSWLPEAKDLSTFSVFSMLSVLGIMVWLVSKSCDGKPEREAFGRMMKGGIEVSNKTLEMLWLIDYLTGSQKDYKYFYKKVVYFARYINNLKAVAQAISANKELVSRMPSITAFNTYLDKLEEDSSDVSYLLELLEEETFNGKYSSWNIFWERVEVAFRLIAELKNKFVDSMVMLGEIDAQMSIVKLCKEFKDKRITFCQPKYVDPAQVETPSIKMVDFWNPLINPEKVVPNSICAGSLYNLPQNIIITGPNASGKSTITKAFIIAVIMAQSLGIAPAKGMELTPFHKIITYLNITDDIAAGNSHFKAGVMRARDVNETFQNLEPHKFGLAAVDEVFNGTTPDEGRAAAYSLIKLLGSQPLGMCITNTHFQLITSLEEEAPMVFANYKVSVADGPDEKIVCPFQIERGISHQNVAFRILKQEGFGDDFLNQAQRVLDGEE